MLTVTVYRWRNDAHDLTTTRALMEAYGKLGEGPGTIAHYIFTDGTGGVVVAESDGVVAAQTAYRTALNLGEFLDLDATRTYTALTLEDALPEVFARIAE